MTEQKEPDYCAEARIIDAASWIVKASAQLSTIKGPLAMELQGILGDVALALLKNFQTMAASGSDVAVDAHILMVRHALLNACGHAWYARSENAKRLLKEYYRS